MATTLKKGPLQVSITETYTLNGREHSVTTKTVYEDIRQTSSRIVTIPTAGGLQVLDFADTVNSAGEYADADVRFLRITNLDDENFITVETAGAPSIPATRITAGSSFLLSDLDGITSITATADSAPCDIEIFIASVEA
tara:strand:- start:163 stop:579 length:417 start_codon:yes stop_codon:yes gene_type:complete